MKHLSLEKRLFMKIRLVVVGKLKEPFLKDMCNEYIKRLQAYASVEVV